jgi:PEGA domain
MTILRGVRTNRQQFSSLESSSCDPEACKACKLKDRMKRVLLIVFVLIGLGVVAGSRFAGAEPLWQYGRIVAVKKSVTTSTKAWVVNTPLDEEHTQYMISVHVQDRIIVGSYELSATQSEPPSEWTPGSAVRLEVSGDSLYLRSATGSLRLHITQRRTAGPMQAVTAEEKKRLSELDAPQSSQSMIGFSKGGESTPEPAPLTPPPPPAPSTGTVMVRSTPFLSEVFVDGDSMGYTPAKIALGPGKHSFRVEKAGYKAWTKEMTITVGSELTLDATLGKQ